MIVGRKQGKSNAKLRKYFLNKYDFQHKIGHQLNFYPSVNNRNQLYELYSKHV